jgi:hypothetical protein
VLAPVQARAPGETSLYNRDHLAAASAFVEATAGVDLTEQVLAVFLPRVEALMRKEFPDITEQKLSRFVELFVAAFREQRPMFRQATERIFADHLTRDDLEAGIAFYSSPAGRRFIEVRPQIAAALAKDGAESLRTMTLEDLDPYMDADQQAAYKAFTESPAGRRLAAAQASIGTASAQFGVRIGRHVSPVAGAKALEQMEKEGNGL